MKILLISANTHNKDIVMPYGICCVASALKKKGHAVHVLDLLFEVKCAKSIFKTIEEFQPDIIGIGIRNIDNGIGIGTVLSLKHVRDEVISPCKQFLSGPIVLGGSAVGVSGPEILQYFDLPYALVGDGEKAMVEFVTHYENNIPLKGISGLLHQRGGVIIEQNPPAIISNLETLDFLENLFSYIDLSIYHELGCPIPIQTKRGCPFKCIYCTYNRIEGPVFRLRNPERIADEIDMLVKRTNIRRFEFVDGIFNVPSDHTKSVLLSIIKKDLNLNLSVANMSPFGLDEEMVDLLQKAGLKSTCLSAESGNDEMLKSLGKNFTKNDLINAAIILKKKGINLAWSLLAGAPGETEKTLIDSFDTVVQLASGMEPVYISAGIRVYNGSPIADIVKKEKPDNVKDNFLSPVCYHPKTINLKRLWGLCEEYVSSHSNFFMLNDTSNDSPLSIKSGIERLLKDIFIGDNRIVSQQLPPWFPSVMYKKIMNVFCSLSATSLGSKKFCREFRLKYACVSEITDWVNIFAINSIDKDLIYKQIEGLQKIKNGGAAASKKVLAIVDDINVAQYFFRPASKKNVADLFREKKIDELQEGISKKIPVVDAICLDNNLTKMSYGSLPESFLVLDKMIQEYSHNKRIFIGISCTSPESAAAAFLLGADFIFYNSAIQKEKSMSEIMSVKKLMEVAAALINGRLRLISSKE
jgi:radical SAM superfamily enzyme YgiQ (UPF0313 family)